MSTVIKPIDASSVHRITSGQVVIDLQTAVKELVENSLDAGATNIEVRFKQYGTKSIEVIDNGCGISEKDHDSIALKHHTSKLSSFIDLTTVRTFGFRGEALSSLCALCESVTVITATEPPMGTHLEFDVSGQVKKRSKVARPRGTSVILNNVFQPLAVRRKELERNAKREYGKALNLLTAYALGPCSNTTSTTTSGVRFSVSNQLEKGQKTVQLRTQGVADGRTAVSAVWGPKASENLVDLDLRLTVERDRTALKRLAAASTSTTPSDDDVAIPVFVKGLISKFSIGCGRTGTDRQFFYINGRPCNVNKLQKTFNEVYRSFNATQAPFILADFIIPTETCDVNVSPDKRTIFIHSENNLISALKAALEVTFDAARSTYDVGGSRTKATTQSLLPGSLSSQLKPRLSNPSRAATDDGESSTLSEQSTSAQQALDESQSFSPTHLDTATSSSQMDIEEPSPPRIRISGSPEGPSMLDEAPASGTSPSPPTVGSGQLEERQTNTRAPPKRSNGITIDTRQAIWNRDSNSPPQEEQAPPDDRPPTKRLKLSVAEKPSSSSSSRLVQSKLTLLPRSSTSTSRNSKERSEARSKNTQLDIRHRLAGFARTGSQVPITDPDGDQEMDELESSPDEREEIPRPNRKHDPPLSPQANEPPAAQNRKQMAGAPAKTPESLDEAEDDQEDSSLTQIDPSFISPPTTSETIPRPEVIRSSHPGTGDISLRFDTARITRLWGRRSNASSKRDDAAISPATAATSKVPLDAGVSNTEDDEKAADALARVIDKDDFSKMEVVGQFNLGFIIARRRKEKTRSKESEKTTMMDDLFIVDQHAADEKYNFETLQQTTVFNSQKLFRPQGLELTAADELLAIENIEVLRQNGFEIQVDEAMEEDEATPRGSRLKLLTKPISKNTVFDTKDLEELIHLMRDRPTGQMVRCSKARAMFAMRACRKSVMVGMPLTKNQMTSVVQHMGTMDQPWNCPHGRPTMRHLADLTGECGFVEKRIRWGDLLMEE